MSIRKTAFVGLLGLCVSLPLSANASELTIINNTSHDSTCILNHGPCSDFLGESGITRAHNTNKVNERVLNAACKLNKKNCVADVYMTANCTGAPVAVVTLDIATGIKTVTPTSTAQGYAVTGSGFTAVLNGGPAIKKNWFMRLLGL